MGKDKKEKETSTKNPFSTIAKPSHQFEVTTFKSPTNCQLCKGFIWGLSKQGSKCSHCGVPVHQQCVDKASTYLCTEANPVLDIICQTLISDTVSKEETILVDFSRDDTVSGLKKRIATKLSGFQADKTQIFMDSQLLTDDTVVYTMPHNEDTKFYAKWSLV